VCCFVLSSGIENASSSGCAHSDGPEWGIEIVTYSVCARSDGPVGGLHVANRDGFRSKSDGANDLPSDLRFKSVRGIINNDDTIIVLKLHVRRFHGHEGTADEEVPHGCGGISTMLQEYSAGRGQGGGGAVRSRRKGTAAQVTRDYIICQHSVGIIGSDTSEALRSVDSRFRLVVKNSKTATYERN
jgi:hypothetical protein